MAVYRLDIAYDGSGFHGYAAQTGLRTVQGELEQALETLLGAGVETSVAGRTDAGVHASGQVVSFSVERPVDPQSMPRALNGILGPEIAIKALTPADDRFNARFSARWRRYRYRVTTSQAPDPLTRNQVWHVSRSLDLTAMEQAAAEYVGEKDFSAFCRSVEGRSNVRRVDEAYWRRSEDDVLEFWIVANSFCHQMVRSLVGLCYDVGRGFVGAESVTEVIAGRDRGRVATVAPPHGLTLWEVGY